jgi:hypothetical protein
MTGWVESTRMRCVADDRRYFAVHVRAAARGPDRAAAVRGRGAGGAGRRQAGIRRGGAALPTSRSCRQALGAGIAAPWPIRRDSAAGDPVSCRREPAAGRERRFPGGSRRRVCRRRGAPRRRRRRPTAPGAGGGPAPAGVRTGSGGDGRRGLGGWSASPTAPRGRCGDQRRTGGTFVVLASPLSAEASTLPTSAAMLPLLERLTGAWAAALPPATDAAPGQEVMLPAGTTAVLHPGRQPRRCLGRCALPSGAGARASTVRSARRHGLAAWAVNPPAAESDLARLDRRGLDARLPGWTLHVTTGRRVAAGDVPAASRQRNLADAAAGCAGRAAPRDCRRRGGPRTQPAASRALGSSPAAEVR